MSDHKNDGWIVFHPKYGRWFVPRKSVIDDWKQDQKRAYPEKTEQEPSEGDVEVWWSQQFSWIEVEKHGTQLDRPNMDFFERQFMEDMKNNVDNASCDTSIFQSSFEKIYGRKFESN